jgi:hypothetical protein
MFDMISKNRILIFILIILAPILSISQRIQGHVESDGPLSRVNITLLDSNTGTTTDSNGNFEINVNIGSTLIFSYLGFKTVEVKVKNFKKVAIKMVPESNVLDEAVVKGSKKSESYSITKPDISTNAFGELDVKNSGYLINHVKGSSLSYAAPNMGATPAVVFALNGKVPNYTVTPTGVLLRSKGSLNLESNNALWEIDGMTYEGFPPPVDLDLIEDIFIIKSLAGTVKYGSRGAGGVIIVNTINNSYGKKQNKNKILPDTSVSYETLDDKNEFLNFEDKEDFNENAKKIGDDINELRGLAYHYQENGEQLLAARLYQKILSLSPTDLKSHRDIAHTWMISRRPLKSWSSYMTGFKQNNNLFDGAIGRIMFSEMERLYLVEELRGKVSGKFKTESDFTDSRNPTTRIVFEWSSGVHGLTIESVNPEGQAYSSNFQPNDETNQTVEEFYLDNTLKGKWSFNVTPQAAPDKPLYLKVTIYPNWYSSIKSTATIKNFIFYYNDDMKYQLFNRMVSGV